MLLTSPTTNGAVLRTAPTILNRQAKGKTLLSCVIHPDDDAWGYGDLLAQRAIDGERVVSALATRGDAGNEGLLPGIADIRMTEQVVSCGHLGVSEVHWLGYSEKTIHQVPFEDLVKRVYDLIIEVEADQVVTYGEFGLTRHQHHIDWHYVVTEACRLADVPVLYVDATPYWDTTIGTILQEVGAIDANVQLMIADPGDLVQPSRLEGDLLRMVQLAVLAHESQVGPLHAKLAEYGGFAALASWFYRETATSSVSSLSALRG